MPGVPQAEEGRRPVQFLPQRRALRRHLAEARAAPEDGPLGAHRTGQGGLLAVPLTPLGAATSRDFERRASSATTTRSSIPTRGATPATSISPPIRWCLCRRFRTKATSSAVTRAWRALHSSPAAPATSRTSASIATRKRPWCRWRRSSSIARTGASSTGRTSSAGTRWSRAWIRRRASAATLRTPARLVMRTRASRRG